MDEITGAQLLKLLSPQTALEVAWQVKQQLPPLPLEIWLEILAHCDADTAWNLLATHNTLCQHLNGSWGARTRLLRRLLTQTFKFYSKGRCWEWSMGSQPCISCYLRRTGCASRLTLYVPGKSEWSRPICYRFKGIICSTRDSVYVLFAAAEGKRRIEFTNSGCEKVFTQNPFRHRLLSFCGNYQDYSAAVDPVQLTTARALAHVLRQLQPLLMQYNASSRYDDYHDLELIMQQQLDFGALVPSVPP